MQALFLVWSGSRVYQVIVFLGGFGAKGFALGFSHTGTGYCRAVYVLDAAIPRSSFSRPYMVCDLCVIFDIFDKLGA